MVCWHDTPLFSAVLIVLVLVLVLVLNEVVLVIDLSRESLPSSKSRVPFEYEYRRSA